jgi:integrase
MAAGAVLEVAYPTAARLRVKDVDFATDQIIVRSGKGDKDRVTMLPAAVKTGLAARLQAVRLQHEADLRQGARWCEQLPVGRGVPRRQH